MKSRKYKIEGSYLVENTKDGKKYYKITKVTKDCIEIETEAFNLVPINVKINWNEIR